LPNKNDIPFEGLAIDGDRVKGSEDGVTEIFDPSNGKKIAIVAQASVYDVNRTVEVAHQRFIKGEWNAMSSRTRGHLLQKVADLIREKLDYLARLESQNAGKPINAAKGEIAAAANCFEYYAGAVNKIYGHTIPGAANGSLMTFREPLGVCALITPWNFPFLITSWKVAPALAMRNCIVIKPAGVTPLSALALADLIVEAGIPPGVVNVLAGSGSLTGEALIAHPLIRKISFTGSTEIGKHIMKVAAEGIKRISLELGGKSANIIFADTDIQTCVESSLFSVFDNAGQDCCSRSRFLVEEKLFDSFVTKFVERTKNMKVGPTDSEETEMGPLITAQHRKSVCNYIDVGDKEGAERLCGGEIPTDGVLASGNYLTAAVYVNVNPDMRVAREEIFGPVVCIMSFKSEDEAVTLANDSPYGLSGSIWTRDISRALRVAHAFETGMISVNSSSSVHIEAPFGGVKQSGIGREQGMAALEHYSELKSIFIAN
jgi:acyl-CoA reductase-like NAD-dependent aldehyde dehydrogenase